MLNNRDGICAAVVADGLGGHGGGQIASQIVAGHIASSFMLNPRIDTGHIRMLFEQANKKVVESQMPGQKMKSTGAALFIHNGAALWGHAGDTRLYHFRNGALVCQTMDHSVSQMAVLSGEITQDQIRNHDDRNMVLKAFGSAERFSAEIAPICVLTHAFHAFLLCTDGFWEYVLENEMESELAKAASPDNWLQFMIRILERRAPKGNDNYSAAAVFVNI